MDTNFSTIAGEDSLDRDDIRENSVWIAPYREIIGDGDPGCSQCQGSGVVPIINDGIIDPFGKADCSCRHDVLRRQELDRVWPGLAGVVPAAESILSGRTAEDLRIRSSVAALRAHLRAALAGDPIRTSVGVVSDSDLLDAQFQARRDIEDDEPARAADLYLPPKLLVLLVGLAPRNKMVPDLLRAAIQRRELQGKHTWVVTLGCRVPEAVHAVVGDWPLVTLGSAQDRGSEAGQDTQDVQPEAQPDAEAAPAQMHADVAAAVAELGGILGREVLRDAQDNGGAVVDCPHCGGRRCSVYWKARIRYKCPSCGQRGSLDDLLGAARAAASPDGAAAPRPGARTKNAASAFLLRKLAQPGAAVATHDLEEAARQEGVAWRSVERAKAALSLQGVVIKAVKRDGRSHWVRNA